jgi:hypothetical protein
MCIFSYDMTALSAYYGLLYASRTLHRWFYLSCRLNRVDRVRVSTRQIQLIRGFSVRTVSVRDVRFHVRFAVSCMLRVV